MRILMYHDVTEGQPKEIHGVSRQRFAEQMTWLREAGYSTLLLEPWLAARKSNAVHDRQVIITFDDGYLDNYERAWPLLSKNGFTATIFLIAGLIGQTSKWRPGRLGDAPLLNWTQIHEMEAGGIHFGSHTLSHCDLRWLPVAEVERELRESRDILERDFSHPITTFSYPFSGVNGDVRAAAKRAGYEVACSSPTGYVGPAGSDLFELQRITVLATDTLEDFQQKLRGTLSRRLQWYRREIGRLRRQLLSRAVH